MTLSLITLYSVLCLLLSLLCYGLGKSKSTKQYWKGRMSGWQACETMVYNRIKDHGYDNKLYADLLQ